VVAVGAVAIGLTTRDHAGPTIAAERPVGSYRIVYQLVFSGQQPQSEERAVQRPYHGFDITRDATSAVVTGQLQNDEGTFQYRTPASSTDAGGWIKLIDKRHLAPSDFRPLPAVRDQVRRRRAELVGHRTIVGRRCVLVRIGGPLGTNDAFRAPTARNHADECIDNTGVALSERWTLNGKLARTLVATSFDPHFTPAADAFAATPRLPDPPPGALGQVDVDMDASARAGFRARVKPFAGFRDDGGVVEVKISPLGGAAGGTTVLRLRRGFEVIEIEQHRDAPAGQVGDRVEHVAPWGDVRFHPDTFASTYEVPLGDNLWIQLRTADLDVLRAALAHLARV